jgi:glycosyltransferase involved in cell wall biosynthesis
LLLGAFPGGEPEFHYVTTHVRGPKLLKVFVAAWGMLHLIWTILFWRCDLAHIHTACYASFLRKSMAASVVRAFGRPVIIHVHGGEFAAFFESSSPRARRRIDRALASADLVIALTEAWKEKLLTMSPGARVRVLPNPVDTRAFEGMDESRVDVSPSGGRALFLGALTKKKGVMDLIDAVTVVAVARPDFVLDVAGHGPAREFVRAAADRGVDRNINYMGWLDEISKLDALGRAHVLVLPSYCEGLSNALLEGLAAGLPVVATPVGGTPEFVTDGVNGLLVEPGDTTAIVASIMRLLSDHELRLTMGSANRELVRSRCDVRVVAEGLGGWYAELGGRTHAH